MLIFTLIFWYTLYTSSIGLSIFSAREKYVLVTFFLIQIKNKKWRSLHAVQIIKSP